jgi:hypothetical protein
MSAHHCRRVVQGIALLLAALAQNARAEDKVWEVMNVWMGHRKPMIDVSYGFGPVKQKLFQGTLSDVSLIDLKLGYFRSKPDSETPPGLDDKFVTFTYSASDLFGRSIVPADVGSTMIRFGMGTRGGYALDFGSSYLYPYHQTSLLWTKVTTNRPPGLSAADTDILDRYEGTFRFGASTEGGIAVGIGDVMSLRFGYEAAAIYPRHVFWPWIGSYGIATIGIGALSHFARQIVEASPTLGPFIYALLRAGLAYGYYLTVRDNQYWPFDSETPLTTEALKFGVTFTF